MEERSWGGKREMVKRPEERTSERGRELVRAGAFPLANSRARDGRWEKEGKTWRLERGREVERKTEGEESKRARERERELETREKTLGRERDGT